MKFTEIVLIVLIACFLADSRRLKKTEIPQLYEIVKEYKEQKATQAFIQSVTKLNYRLSDYEEGTNTEPFETLDKDAKSALEDVKKEINNDKEFEHTSILLTHYKLKCARSALKSLIIKIPLLAGFLGDKISIKECGGQPDTNLGTMFQNMITRILTYSQPEKEENKLLLKCINKYYDNQNLKGTGEFNKVKINKLLSMFIADKEHTNLINQIKAIFADAFEQTKFDLIKFAEEHFIRIIIAETNAAILRDKTLLPK